MICYRRHYCRDEQMEENRKKSTIRSRVELVFWFMEGAMHGLTVRTIGTSESHGTHLPEMSNVQHVQVQAICKKRNKITEKSIETNRNRGKNM